MTVDERTSEVLAGLKELERRALQARELALGGQLGEALRDLLSLWCDSPCDVGQLELNVVHSIMHSPEGTVPDALISLAEDVDEAVTDYHEATSGE